MQRLVFALFPLSQLACAVTALIWIVQLGMPQGFLWLVVGLMVACVPADWLLFREIRNAQDADVAQRKVEMLQEQERIQQQYRQQLARDRQEIRALRARVADELGKAAEALEQCEAPAAERDMRKAIELMGESSYRLCANRSVDAVATMKMRACEEAGVEPRFALEVPEEVAVPPVELCAVVANLADNGLAAAMRAKEAGATDAFLVLRVRPRGDYLVLEARNSLAPDEARAAADRARKKRRARRSLDEVHGWGLSIIEGIAERHDGDVTCEVVDGCFRTAVVLYAPARAKGAGEESAAGAGTATDAGEGNAPGAAGPAAGTASGEGAARDGRL